MQSNTSVAARISSPHDDDDVANTPFASTSTLPSAAMTTPQYLRIHANASPAKLRNIIMSQIFPADDLEYLKRLVGDVGHMDYVFRYLWYDGPKPISFYADWDSAQIQIKSPSAFSGTQSSCSSKKDLNWSVSASGSRRLSPPELRTSKSIPSSRENSAGPSTSKVESHHGGRTWIQYCCYHNAHQCLRWIFGEIYRNHIDKIQMEPEQTVESDTELRETQTTKRTLAKANDTNPFQVIRQLLEYPSLCYCATNYVAVAALRNSHDCLSLLLECGGLDPNISINCHGSTAAHLAALRDNVECLQVLKSGCYHCEMFLGNDHDADDSIVNIDSDESFDDDNHLNERDHGVPSAYIKTWAADWNQRNALGETPVHVAAREGSVNAMQFFLNISISHCESLVFNDSTCDDVEVSLIPGPNQRDQCDGEYTEGCIVDFSLRNKDGMDCTALAAKNNHISIINLLASAIQQIKEIERERRTTSFIPSLGEMPEHTFSSTSAHPQDHSASRPPPQSSNIAYHTRRRANSEPVTAYTKKDRNTAPYKPSHSLPSLEQFTLPRHYPSLNLNNSLDINNHETPIHVAARCGNPSIIKALFDSGGICNTSARDSLGQTALHVAVLAGNLDVCKLFVELRAEEFQNFDVVDILGRTPLYIACLLGNSSIARILTPVSNWRVICRERRKSPDGPLYANVANQPALHAAVANDHVNTASVLLECGVDVDQPDVDGRTAINAAAKLGYYEMCQMLILHGANVNARSLKGGPTPYQKARKYKHNDVADLLYEFGGR